MTLTDQEIEFMTHSNYIEGESGDIEQQARAWQFLKLQKHLTNQKICKAHKILMLDKPYPPPRGYYRSVPDINVMIGGRTAPAAALVDSLMDNWLLDYRELGWKDAHIRFESIHPFVDGNGRIGRLLLNWQRLQEGLPILVILEEERFEYYKWFKDLQ